MKIAHLMICAALAVAGAARAEPLLTLADARAHALQTYPRITIAKLRSLIAREGVAEARAGYLPYIAANATAVDSGEQVTRIAAGGLSNSQIFDHTGVGATLGMLLTDFGHTEHLTAAARERAKSAEENEIATRAQILLEVDAAYFDALKAHAVQAVAANTLRVRQALFDRANALAQNQLKSELDVRFARVSLDEARLIVEDAEKQWQSALATLANLVGDTNIVSGVELQEPAAAGALPANVDPLIDVAMAQRPDLLGSRAAAKAAHEAALAARAARYPTVSLAATAGVVPTSDPHFQHNFAAGGINVNVPVFTGGLYAARQREAEAVANAADASLTQSTTELMRDVRLAWLEAKHAEDRIGLTRSLAENARAALELARARFDQGLTSTIELTQAELAQTSADIALTTAQYDYRIRRDMVDYVIGALR